MRKLIIIAAVLTLSACHAVKEIDCVENLIRKSDGNTIILKKGNFRITKSLILNSGTNIQGKNTCIQISPSDVFPLISFIDVSNVTLKNVKFYGVKLNGEVDDQFLRKANYDNLLQIKDSRNITIENCAFSNHSGTCVKLHDSENVKIDKCSFENIGVSTFKNLPYSYDGIFIGAVNKTDGVTISNSSFKNIGYSFPKGNPPWPNDGDGVHIQGIGSINNITINNCRFEGCSSRAVKIQSGSNIKISNNLINRGWSAVILAMISSVKNVQIKNNTITNVRITVGTDTPFESQYVENLEIINNTVDTCYHFFRTSGYSNVSNAKITNNKVGESGTFFVSGRFKNTVIANNIVEKFATKDDPSYIMGFIMSPESDKVKIQNNTLHGESDRSYLIYNLSKNDIQLTNNHFTKQADKAKLKQ